MADSFITRKLGPAPMWAWMGGVLAVLIGVSLWRNSKSSTAATGATDAGTSADTVPSDQVPDYITQVYNTVNATTGQPTTSGAPPTTTPVQPTPPVIPIKKPTPPTTPPVAAKPVAKAPVSYKVKSGDTLTSIAKHYGTTWQALWTFNTTSGNRPAATIATLKQRGPNLLYSGETILIPQK